MKRQAQPIDRGRVVSGGLKVGDNVEAGTKDG